MKRGREQGLEVLVERARKTKLAKHSYESVTKDSQDFTGLDFRLGAIRRSTDTSLGIVRDTLLEEVGLSLEGDHVHEVKGVCDVVDLVRPESNEKTVSDKLDVLAHQCRVHANE